MKHLKHFLAGLLALLSLTGILLPANANSAIWIWEGEENSGSMVTGEGCPVVVEKELLTFDIQSFPMKELRKGNKDYSASVTAEYSLYNPSEEEITMELIFPFGERPSYYYEWAMVNAPDVPYSITAGGEELPYTIRHIATVGHTPVVSYDSFSKISNSYWEDAFFRPDLPVTIYTYELVDTDKGPLALDDLGYFGFEMPELPEGTRIAFPDMENFGTDFDSETCYFAKCVYGPELSSNGSKDSLKIYFLGETPGEPLQPVAFKNWNSEHHYFSDPYAPDSYLGEVTVESTTLIELADSLNPPECGYSSLDWYNGLVAKMIADGERNPGGILTLNKAFCLEGYVDEWRYGEDRIPHLDFYGLSEYDWEFFPPPLEERMMSCYVYSLTIGPGEKLLHRVTAPLYPSIVDNIGTRDFQYLYILSAAKSWADFSNLEIEIHTPFLLGYSSLQNFTKETWGYRFTSDKLPEGDLYFTLDGYSAYEKPDPEPDLDSDNTENTQQPPSTEAVAASPVAKKNPMPKLLLTIAVVIAATAILFLVVRKKKGE